MKARKLKTEGGMTPMIDCVFLLLIFFVVSCKFKTTEGHLDIFLPKYEGGNAGIARDGEELRIRATFHGPEIHLSLNSLRIGTYPAMLRSWGLRNSPDYNPGRLSEVVEKLALDVRTKLVPRLAGEPKERRVVVDVDPEAPYVFAVEAMNACLAAGITEAKFASPRQRMSPGSAITAQR
ncbi:MAG: ExbD/TolR family protein [Planctomycetota bacterium]